MRYVDGDRVNIEIRDEFERTLAISYTLPVHRFFYLHNSNRSNCRTVPRAASSVHECKPTMGMLALKNRNVVNYTCMNYVDASGCAIVRSTGMTPSVQPVHEQKAPCVIYKHFRTLLVSTLVFVDRRST